MNKEINNPEDKKIKQLLDAIGSDDTQIRTNARKQLAELGEKSIDYLMELVDHPKHIYRWEALKTLNDINDPLAIPISLQALEDDESDIRWIAAEGLINLGQKSIEPLLKLLIEKSDSVFVLAGAHHVFYDLKKTGKLPDKFPVDEILAATKKHELRKGIKSIAYEILNDKSN